MAVQHEIVPAKLGCPARLPTACEGAREIGGSPSGLVRKLYMSNLCLSHPPPLFRPSLFRPSFLPGQMFQDIRNFVELRLGFISLNQGAPFGAGGNSNSK